MFKTGDVIVVDEKKLEALWGAETVSSTEPLGDLRQGVRFARTAIEDSDEAREVAIVRIERVARSRAKKPAFEAVFDGEVETSEGGAS